jgi:hypothetical protein
VTLQKHFCNAGSTSKVTIDLERWMGIEQVVGIISPWVDAAPAAYHSISLTGGEPLLHDALLADWLPELRRLLPIYLETSGTQPERLEPLLPQMAEIDPGPAFTARVVKETSRRESYRKPVYAGPTGAAGLMDRVGRWWEQQVMRPMFAAQVAYVATVLLVLLMTVPGSPFKQVPGKALEAVQAGPTSTPVIGPLLDSAADWAGFRADNPLTVARDGLDTKIDKVTGSLGERGRRTAAGRQDFAAHVKVMFSRIGDRQMDEAGYEFLQALDAGRLIWKEWWKDNDANGQ